MGHLHYEYFLCLRLGDRCVPELLRVIQVGTSLPRTGALRDVNAATSRRRPLCFRFPRPSRIATARATRLLIRICPSSPRNILAGSTEIYLCISSVLPSSRVWVRFGCLEGRDTSAGLSARVGTGLYSRPCIWTVELQQWRAGLGQDGAQSRDRWREEIAGGGQHHKRFRHLQLGPPIANRIVRRRLVHSPSAASLRLPDDRIQPRRDRATFVGAALVADELGVIGIPALDELELALDRGLIADEHQTAAVHCPSLARHDLRSE